VTIPPRLYRSAWYTVSNRAENLMPYGILGLLVLVLDIYVIYLIVTGSGDAGIKLIWVIVVLLLPLLGPILYLVIGRGKVR
jgi:hypothetical protein